MSKSVTLHWAPADLAAVAAGCGVWRHLDPCTGACRALTSSERAWVDSEQAKLDACDWGVATAEDTGGYGWFVTDAGEVADG